MSRDFHAGFCTCLIEECYLNWMCLANVANSRGLMPSLVVVIWKKPFQVDPVVFHSNELLSESGIASVAQMLDCSVQLTYEMT